jgi:hypothetical protein
MDGKAAIRVDRAGSQGGRKTQTRSVRIEPFLLKRIAVLRCQHGQGCEMGATIKPSDVRDAR